MVNRHPHTSAASSYAPKEALKAEIANMVMQRGGVTFAEMMSIPGFAGDIEFVKVSEHQNFEALIWTDMTPAAAAALDELCVEKTIAASICSPLLYLYDGAIPALPVLSSQSIQRTKPFKRLKRFWAPIKFSAYQRVKEADRIPLRFRVPAAQLALEPTADAMLEREDRMREVKDDPHPDFSDNYDDSLDEDFDSGGA